MKEITTKSACALSVLIRDREISCREVTTAFLEKIDAVNPKINAFCTVVHEAALAAASGADRALASGSPIGSLHGLPIAFKDLTPTKGIRTTRGSRLFEKAVPAEDAVLVTRLKKAGAIVVGKTNTPEFGHKAVTDNLIFGPTRNPWRPDRTAGGSSGGAAAAVAAGLVPFAEGSDGAGSIRIPASMCGVFGFKPTYGRVPDVAGPFSSHTPFLHNGPLAQTVSDAVLLFEAMAGFDASHPFSVPTHESVFSSLDDDVAGLRIAFSMNLGCFQISEEVQLACTQAAKQFDALGCVVTETEINFGQGLEEAFFTLWCAKLATFYGDLSGQEFALLEPVVQGLIERGKRLSAVEYGRANLVREVVWRVLCGVFQSHDILICPTTAIPAFPIEGGPPARIKGTAVDPLLGWFLTYPFNLTGNPVASVPCGLSQDGLPIGLQIVGRRLGDALVLRTARAFERISPWPKLAKV